MEIWDSHVHLFPPEIYRNWEKYAPRDPWFQTLTKKSANGRGTEEAWATAEEALACANAAGVTGLLMQGWYWNDEGLQKLHNDYMAQVMADHPSRIRGFMAINPMFGDSALYEAERCLSLGFEGIGELGPGGNGYHFRSREFLNLLDLAEENHLPVCIHCGEPVGHPYPGRDTTPLAPLPDAIATHPGVKFILAHLGGGLPFYTLNKRIAKQLSNVWYDTAANPLLYDLRSVKVVCDLVDADKLLFGSDFPLLLYPGQCREMDMTRWVRQITKESGLTAEQLAQVMGNNLKNVLNI